MENVFITPSLVQKHGEGTLERTFPPPATSPLSRTRRLPRPGSTTEHVCECFLMHTDGAGVKMGRPFPLQFCCCERVLLSLWVWLHYHLPPQAYFPFSKHARFPP